MKAFWMNGRVVAEHEATVSVLDHGLLYGDGVFEGIRCVQGAVVDLDQHLKRLELSARSIHLPLPPLEQQRRAVLETLRALGAPDAYVRLLVTRGVGELGIDTSSCREPALVCIAGALQLYAVSELGLRLATVSVRRPPFDVLDPRVKSLNYLNNVLARIEAKQKGADEALVLNARGTVAEASAANVFAVLDGTVTTPPAADGALGGITRGRALRLLARDGIPTREASLTRFDLYAASEVFLTGTGAGVVSAGLLDGEPLGTDRTVAHRLVAAMREYAREHGTPVLSAPSARVA